MLSHAATFFTTWEGGESQNYAPTAALLEN